MISSKALNGKPLISLTDGKKVGEIKGIYLDPNLQWVTGVFVNTEGVIHRKTLAVARSRVQLTGIDAWLVSGPDVVLPLEELADSAGFILAADLRGREIQTEGGTKVGTVEDVLLDATSNVAGFTLGKVYAQGPLAERKAVIRAAITDLGDQERPMTVDLAKAEAQAIPSE